MEDLSNPIHNLPGAPNPPGPGSNPRVPGSQASAPAPHGLASAPTENNSEQASAPLGGPVGTRPKAAGSSSTSSSIKRPSAELISRMVKIVFPSDDRIKEFGEIVGQNPNFTRFLQNSAFAESFWQYESSPSEKQRRRLFWDAVEIQGGKTLRRRAQERAAKDTKSKQQSDSVPASSRKTSVESGKRLRSPSTSTERLTSTTGAALHGFKIPKLAASNVPSTEETSEQDDSAMVGIVDEDSISMEDVRRSLDDLTYAGVAGDKASTGKRKKEYPFILHVHSGTEEREPITRDTWQMLSSKIDERLVTFDIEGDPIEADFHAFSKGAGIYAITDDRSRSRMQALVAETQVAGHHFRAWAKGEKGTHTHLVTRVPMSLEKVAGGKITAALMKRAGIADDDYKLISCHSSKGNPQRILRIGFTEAAMTILHQRDMRLKVGSNTVTFSSL